MPGVSGQVLNSQAHIGGEAQYIRECPRCLIPIRRIRSGVAFDARDPQELLSGCQQFIRMVVDPC